MNNSTDIFSKDTRPYLMGLAIIGVVMVHVSTQEVDHPLHTIISAFFSKGHLGVNIFFLLSAYGLCYSYNNNSLKRFYLNRAIRIWPMFPIALIARYVVKGIPLQYAFEKFFYEISGFFLFQVKRDFFWYMGVLTIMYLFFPLLYELFYKLRKNKLTILFLICILSHILLMHDYGHNDIYIETITRIPTIYLGILTYFCVREKELNKLYVAYGFCALLSLTQIQEMTCLFLPAAMLVISYSRTRPLNKPISFMGRHSLEIYLGHTFAIYHILFFPWSYPINLLLFFLTSALYSYLLYLVHHVFHKLITTQILNCITPSNNGRE